MPRGWTVIHSVESSETFHSPKSLTSRTFVTLEVIQSPCHWGQMTGSPARCSGTEALSAERKVVSPITRQYLEICTVWCRKFSIIQLTIRCWCCHVRKHQVYVVNILIKVWRLGSETFISQKNDRSPIWPPAIDHSRAQRQSQNNPQVSFLWHGCDESRVFKHRWSLKKTIQQVTKKFLSVTHSIKTCSTSSTEVPWSKALDSQLPSVQGGMSCDRHVTPTGSTWQW